MKLLMNHCFDKVNLSITKKSFLTFLLGFGRNVYQYWEWRCHDERIHDSSGYKRSDVEILRNRCKGSLEAEAEIYQIG